MSRTRTIGIIALLLTATLVGLTANPVTAHPGTGGHVSKIQTDTTDFTIPGTTSPDRDTNNNLHLDFVLTNPAGHDQIRGVKFEVPSTGPTLTFASQSNIGLGWTESIAGSTITYTAEGPEDPGFPPSCGPGHPLGACDPEQPGWNPGTTLSVALRVQVSGVTPGTSPTIPLTATVTVIDDADGNNNNIDEIPQPVTINVIVDAITPTVSKIQTMDVDGNARVDWLKITFSENVRDSSLDRDDWSVPAAYSDEAAWDEDTLDAGIDGRADDDDIVHEPLAICSGAPKRPFNALDLVGSGGDDIVSADSAADTSLCHPGDNNDAVIYIAVFEQPVSISDIDTDADLPGSVSYTRNREDRASNANANNDDSDFDSGSRHDDLVDVNGNVLANVAGLTVKDGAGPVVLKAVVDLESDQVFVTFSEKVKRTNGASLLPTDFTYTDNGLAGNAAVPLSVVHATGANADKATITLDEITNAADIGQSGGPADLVGLKVTTVRDLANNPALSFTTPLSDTLKPTVASIRTADRDGDGLLDAILVEMSEPIQDSTIDGGSSCGSGPDRFKNWRLAAPYGVPETSNPSVRHPSGCLSDVPDQFDDPDALLLPHVNDRWFYLTFPELTTVTSDTEAIVDVTQYNDDNGFILDISDNQIDGDTLPTETDGASPVLKDAITVDLDSNGLLDTLLLEFTEPVVLADAADAKNEWQVDIGGDLVADFGSPALTDVLIGTGTTAALVFEERDLFGGDTGVHPLLAYATGASAGLGDAAGNPLDVDGTDNDGEYNAVVVDGAPPVIRHITARDPVQTGPLTTTFVNVVFSEGVDNGVGAAVQHGAFTYANNDGTSGGADGIKATASITHTPGSPSLKLTLKNGAGAAALTASDRGSDTFGILANKAFGVDDDAAVAAKSGIKFLESQGPAIASIKTLDVNGDGHIDNIEVKFTEEINPGGAPGSQFDRKEWTVGAPYGDSNNYPIKVTPLIGFTNKLTLELDVQDDPDTGVKPTVTFTPLAGKGLKDKDLNAVAAFAQTSADGAKPVVLTAMTQDGDKDGQLDGVALTFSETIVMPSAATTADWTVGSFGAPSGFSGHVGAAITLDLTETTTPDTGDTFTYAVAANAIKDAAGNGILAIAAGGVVDGAAPVALSFETNDDDGNGLLDLIVVDFSEDVVGTSTLSPSGWSIGTPFGGAPTSVAGGLTSSQLYLWLEEQEGITGDTDATPSIGYTSLGGVSDGDNDVADFSGVTPVDAAPAAIVSVDNEAQANKIRITFSEKVKDEENGPLTAADFTYTDVSTSDATSITSVSHAAETKTAILTLDADFNNAVDLVDTLAFKATPGQVLDLAGNVALTTSFTLDVVPKLQKAVTIDNNGDGYIDAVRVFFTKPIKDLPTFPSSHWVVGSEPLTAVSATPDPYYGVNGRPLSVTTGAVADDNIILLTIDDLNGENVDDGGGATPWPYDTAHKPSVTYAFDVGSRIKDAHGNTVPNGGVTSKDGAPAIVIDAVTKDADADGLLDGYVVTFSEDMDAATFQKAEWKSAGTGATGGSWLAANALSLTFPENLAIESGALPELTYTPLGTLRDTAGVALKTITAGTTTFAESDGAGPVLTSAVGLPGSKEVTLTFSEGVVDETGTKLVASDLAVDVGSTGRTVASLTHTAGSRTAKLVFDANLNADDFGAMEVRIGSPTSIFDAADNAAPAAQATHPINDGAVEDTVPPAQVTGLTSSDIKAAPEWNTQLAVGTVTWTSASDPAPGSGVAGYSYIVTTLGSTDEPDATVQTTSTSAPITVTGDGKWLLKVAAVDIAGNVGASATREIWVDTTAPVVGVLSSTTHPADACTTASSVDVSWTVATDATSGLDLTSPYGIAIGSAAQEFQTGTTKTFAAVSAGASTVTLTAFDAAGNSHSTTLAVDIADVPTATVTVPASAKEGFTISWTGVGCETDADKLSYKVESRLSGAATFDDITPATATTSIESFTPTVDGTYEFKVTVTDAADQEATSTIATTVFDTTPPTAVSDLTATLEGGNVKLAWTAATDAGVGVAEYQVQRSTTADGTYTTIATPTDNAYTDTPSGFVGDRTFFYRVVAVDALDHAAGVSNIVNETVTITEATGMTKAQIAAANVALRGSLGVTPGTGLFDLRWSLPTTELPVLGLQIWRFNSPPTLIDDVASMTEYTDSDAPDNSKYIVTAYFGNTFDLGKVTQLSDAPGYDDLSDDEIEALAVGPVEQDTGLDWWVWLIIALVILIVIALVIVLIMVARRKQAADVSDGAWDDDADTWDDSVGESEPWDEPEAHAEADEEAHELQCPQCHSDFTAFGQRPLKTQCPTCHVKGVLN